MVACQQSVQHADAPTPPRMLFEDMSCMGPVIRTLRMLFWKCKLAWSSFAAEVARAC